MCGRYALALRPSQIRDMLQDDDMPVDGAPADEGDGAPRQSYNFAPTYRGVVYRADVPDRGAGYGASHRQHGHSASSQQEGEDAPPNKPDDDDNDNTNSSESRHHTTSKSKADTAYTPHGHYILQSMKWGLIPSWTKRSPDYAAVLKTINCRADSLAQAGGLWASMKARKRCVVLAQGFYEWLKTGPGGKEKVPHYVKRRDGRLMCFAGLWDCVDYGKGRGGEGDGGGDEDGTGVKNYTYTIITTDSNAQLKFLHDRMPAILEPASEAMWTWLDPGRNTWSRELQAVLRPYDGELEVYPVSKEVGKVGNNSPSFVIPVASKENKGNIANFFAAAAAHDGKKKAGRTVKPEVELELKKGDTEESIETKTVDELAATADDGGMGLRSKGVKREAESSPGLGDPPAKKTASAFRGASPVKEKQQGRGKISATSNSARSPAKNKAKADGSQKITKFFGNSA